MVNKIKPNNNNNIIIIIIYIFLIHTLAADRDAPIAFLLHQTNRHHIQYSWMEKDRFPRSFAGGKIWRNEGRKHDRRITKHRQISQINSADRSINRQTVGQTDRRTDRQTNGQTDRWTNRQSVKNMNCVIKCQHQTLSHTFTFHTLILFIYIFIYICVCVYYKFYY